MSLKHTRIFAFTNKINTTDFADYRKPISRLSFSRNCIFSFSISNMFLFSVTVLSVSETRISAKPCCDGANHALTINYMKYWLVRIAARTLRYNTVRMD